MSGWGSGKVFLDIIFKIQENLIIMISNSIEMLFIINSNTFLQKKCKTFYIDLWSCLVAYLMCFYPTFDGKFCPFLNARLILELVLSKVWYTNFDKFQFQSMSSKIEQAFENRTKNVFCLHFWNIIFLHFIFNFNNKLFHILNNYWIYVMN